MCIIKTWPEIAQKWCCFHCKQWLVGIYSSWLGLDLVYFYFNITTILFIWQYWPDWTNSKSIELITHAQSFCLNHLIVFTVCCTIHCICVFTAYDCYFALTIFISSSLVLWLVSCWKELHCSLNKIVSNSLQ